MRNLELSSIILGPWTLSGLTLIAGSEGEAVWVCSVTSVACDTGSITIGGGATSVAVVVAETGSDDAIDDGIVSIVPVTGATMVVTGTHSSGGVVCL